jgi:hypothetical protein
MNNEFKYTVRGTCEDGSLYWNGLGWAHDKAEAAEMDFAMACEVQDAAKKVQNSLGNDKWIYNIVID